MYFTIIILSRKRYNITADLYIKNNIDKIRSES